MSFSRSISHETRIFVFIAAVVVLGTSSATQAGTIDWNIFSDDFTGSTLGSQWTVAYGTVTSPTVSDGKLSISTAMADNLWVVTTDPVNFTSSPTDWWAEVKYSLAGTVGYSSSGATDDREWVILAGSSNEGANPYTGTLNYISGFSLRAYDTSTPSIPSGKYTLRWYGHDGSGDYPQDLQADMVDGQIYTIAVHRKSDDTVDIYLDGDLIANKDLILGDNPVRLFLGEASSYCGGTQLVDYVRVGVEIPEPSTMALLTAGLLGLLAYAWRRRK